MRILHVIYDALGNPWIGGGGARGCHEICKRLAARHRVVVVTGNFPGAPEGECDGVRYVRVGSARGKWASRLSFCADVYRAIARIPHDVVVNDFLAFAPVFPRLATSRPIVHALANHFGRHVFKRGFLAGMPSWCAERIIENSADPIVAISHGVASQVLSNRLRREHQVQVILYGIEDRYLNTPYVPPPSTTPPLVLFAGRLEMYQKGLDTLLHACKHIVRSRQIRLVLAARHAHSDTRRLAALIADLDLSRTAEIRIDAENDVLPLLQSATIVVIPSRFEAWGIAAVEAAAVGRSVVATSIPGLSEAVVDGVTGLLVPPDHPGALAAAIVTLLDNPSLRESIARSARAHAQSFGWDSATAEREQLFEDLVNGGPRWTARPVQL
jgi:glycosyltransferase involved in cell wall biosynthesis